MGGVGEKCNFDPIATAVATPWRTQPLIDALAAGPLYRNAVKLSEGQLKAANYTTYDLSRMPTCDPATASPEIAEQWLSQVNSSWASSNPYVTLEFLKNKTLPRSTQRLCRENIKRVSDRLASVLARTPRYTKLVKDPLPPGYYDLPSEPVRPTLHPALPSYSAWDAVSYWDAGIAAFTAAKLTVDQMALAFTLLSDGFSGTVNDLIAVVQTV